MTGSGRVVGHLQFGTEEKIGDKQSRSALDWLSPPSRTSQWISSGTARYLGQAAEDL